MPEVVTRGTGEHEVTADLAEVDVAFSANAADRSGAVTLLGQRTAAVDAALAGHAGVEQRHRSVSVHAHWERDRQVGCVATQQLTLRVTDLPELDALLATLFSAEPDRLSGPSWRLADESAATGEAQRKAVADARERAQAYADALGARLGALIRIADEGGDHPYPMMMDTAMESGMGGAVSRQAVRDLGLTPGKVTVRASCTAVWSLQY